MILLTKAEQKEFERHLENLISCKAEYESERTNESLRKWITQFLSVYRKATTLEQLEFLKQANGAPNARWSSVLEKQIRLRKHARVTAKNVLRAQLVLLKKCSSEKQRRMQMGKLLEFIERMIMNHDVLLGVLDALSEEDE